MMSEQQQTCLRSIAAMQAFWPARCGTNMTFSSDVLRLLLPAINAW
jgi:hypothetical protein